jgi:hypothetical protein
MPTITDVSPIKNAPAIGHSVIGRMLSVACTPDGQTQYIGSYSNLWRSTDDGQHWEQLTWPQPDPSQFVAPGSLGGWCVMDIATNTGWRVEKHLRFLAQLRRPRSVRDKRLDIIGFGDCGVWTAFGNGDGTFQQPNILFPEFGDQAGGWHVDKHPRFAVDLTGDGCADIVGFGEDGVWTAINNGDGTFQSPRFVLEDFGVNQGWHLEKHLRFVLDLTGDGHADIIGFGDAGVWIALGDGQGGFGPAQFALENFGVNQGWQVDKHPRFVTRLTSGKFADIIGFGDAGVWTALGQGNGGFSGPNFVLANFGVDQSWQVEKHVRLVADLNGDGNADIIGFGDAGVYTSLGDGNGGFAPAQFVLANFGVDQSWKVDQHPRFVAKLTNSGFLDIVGFGDDGVWTALGKAGGSFNDAAFVLQNLGVNQGWREDRHPRLLGDLNGDGLSDIVGFGDAGVWTSLADGHGGFPSFNFVLANFGHKNILVVVTRNDLIAGSRGIWRSTDDGDTWQEVLAIPGRGDIGQLQWAQASDHLIYAAIGNGLAISKNAGATFDVVLPWGTGPTASVNHVAVWQNEGADLFPSVIYALGSGTMFVSFDGGATWFRDQGGIPNTIGGPTNSTANFNSPTVMVISPRCPLHVIVTTNGSVAPAALYKGDYTRFMGTHASSWDTLPLPDVLTKPDSQDSGDISLIVTQRGRGDLLFYGVQRFDGNFSQAAPYVGLIEPKSGSDWIKLGDVHVDMHGLCLAPDFAATIENGSYNHIHGSMWVLSDGGVYRSTNGGSNLDRGQNANTLSTINLAGVAVPGHGPAMSLNTGDNDGFYTMDGGQNWSYQQYGGGDNDRSYADPLRPHAMMVWTPRWDTAGNIADHTVDGQTVAVYQTSPGNLPNAAQGTGDRKAVTGPPTEKNIWNASSFYGNRGAKPIVFALAGETSPAQGDYIFVLRPLSQPVLVRTQNIFDIKHREEWITTATGPGQGANVFLQGPAMPTPATNLGIRDPSLGVLQASGGHQNPLYYVGGDGTLWKATASSPSWTKIVPAAPNQRSVGANVAVRFFVSPYQPNVVYLLDSDHVKRSDDGGQTWVIDQNLHTQLTWNGQISPIVDDRWSSVGDLFDVVLTDMVFDPNNPTIRFAVGLGGAFMTTDGVSWTRLLHTGAFPGRPTNCFYDPVSNSTNPALYVGFAGRSVVKITDLPLNIIL